MRNEQAFYGKGYWIWKVQYTEAGNIAMIVDKAIQGGYSHIAIKISNGEFDYNVIDGVDLAAQLAYAARQAGLNVLGWTYIYGSAEYARPAIEAQSFAERCIALSVDGAIINAEKEYKLNPHKEAQEFCDQLRTSLPQDMAIALSTYRFPAWHAPFPFEIFSNISDVCMPQIYWEGSHNPATQLARSFKEWEAFGYDENTFVPTGSAYMRGDWEPTPDDVTEFLTAVEDSHFPGVNFWEWAHTVKYLPNLWAQLSAYEWAGGGAPVPPEPPDNGDGNMDNLVAKYKALEAQDVQALVVLFEDGTGNVIPKPPPAPVDPPEPDPDPDYVLPDGYGLVAPNQRFKIEYTLGDNGQNYPIMEEYPRGTTNKWRDCIYVDPAQGDTLAVDKSPTIRGDSAKKYFKVDPNQPLIQIQLRNRPVPENGFYAWKGYVIKQW